MAQETSWIWRVLLVNPKMDFSWYIARDRGCLRARAFRYEGESIATGAVFVLVLHPQINLKDLFNTVV